MSLEDREALERIVMSSDWPVFLKYVKKLRKPIDDSLLEANLDDDLNHLHGKTKGAKALEKAIIDFKVYLRKETKDATKD